MCWWTIGVEIAYVTAIDKPIEAWKDSSGFFIGHRERAIFCTGLDAIPLIFNTVLLARKWTGVSTRWGEVRIKIASMNGTVTNYAPEYEDCRRIAAEQHVPLKTVMQEATRRYLGKDEKR